MASQNYSDNIRQAVLIRWAKAEASLPKEEVLEHVRNDDLWRDWAPCVREAGDDWGRRQGSAEQRVGSGARVWAEARRRRGEANAPAVSGQVPLSLRVRARLLRK